VVDVSYVPGTLTAVTGDQCWALVETSPDSPAVSRIWQQLGRGAAADALLADLVTGGLDSAAGFTLLVAGTGGQHRLFCRGTVGATVVAAPTDGTAPDEGQAATERIDGAGLLTWREQVVGSAARIFLGEIPADTALRLPAASGVLLADCVIIDLANAAARDAVSSPPESPPKKSIVFFPDTMTRPSGLAGRASAASPAAGYQPEERAVAPAAPTAPFTGPVGPPVPPGSPARPDVPGSGAFPAPPVPGPGTAGIFGGPVSAGAAHGPSGAGGDDTDRDFPRSGASRTAADAPAPPPEYADWTPHNPFSPGSVPMPGGYPGTGPQPPPQYQGAPAAAQPWQPLPDGAWYVETSSDETWSDDAWLDEAWSDEARPEWGAPDGAHQGMLVSGQVPPPVSAPPPGPPGGGMPPDGVPPVPAGGLIDTPPWLSGPGGPVPVSPVPVSGVPVESAYKPNAPRAEPGPGDSGATIKRGEFSDLVAITIPPDRIGPIVPALLCPSGHVNPPSDAVCRRCGAPLPHDPVPVPRPVLGVLRLSLGDVITLDRSVLMGRNPRTDFAETDGQERPHVVKLPSADGDISRTHLRVTLDGWHVLVTDLNSTNGTLVTLPGRDPQQLRPGETVPIQLGTVVTLADGIDFRYEVAE
jgi:hypothetical protein